MAKIKSVFGPYADRLQVMIDASLAVFEPTWFERYFDWGIPQASLTFVTAIGRNRIEAAASVVDRDSQSPLRGRGGLEKLTGDIPAIKEKIKMTESDYRDFMTLQQMSIADGVKKQQLLDLMFNDVKTVGNSAMKRLDIMCLEAVSKGSISLDVVNNPDGVVLDNPLDLLMPAGNKTTVSTPWSNTADATPFDDIQAVVEYHQARGVSFSKILMTRVAWGELIKTDQVRNYLQTFLRLGSANVMPTMSMVNEFLQENAFPPIELVDRSVGIEKDGVIATIKPFADTAVSFIPQGKLGKIHNAICLEEIRPVENVAYSKFKQALISKWAENEPFGEYTKVELNAFPGLDAIDSIHILTI